MDPRLSTWLNLALRWFHVVAAVFWIGQTAFFAWLDRRLALEADPEAGPRLWMVHSGGFYRIERLAAPEGGRILHWFKWEALLTWISGFLLLTLVYYLGGALVDPTAGIPGGVAIGVGLGSLIGGWAAYELLWRSPVGRHQRLGAVLSLGLLLAIAYGLSRILSGRATYLHIGALMGTVMTANVWLHILPAQRRLVARAAAGRPPDPTLSARAKERSTHNTFMALPLIFLMVSHHYPTVSYGQRLNWAWLALFLATGFAARWALSRWEARSLAAGRAEASPDG